ncbi:hypothetical protein AURDEDRAFT_121900 [Auricularia subglabra TFB-10046 SS5]|nr:hypothetical protein AURDEDRAFT_121900 [Auricularia subglabra TFB-10046 SS5]
MAHWNFQPIYPPLFAAFLPPMTVCPVNPPYEPGEGAYQTWTYRSAMHAPYIPFSLLEHYWYPYWHPILTSVFQRATFVTCAQRRDVYGRRTPDYVVLRILTYGSGQPYFTRGGIGYPAVVSEIRQYGTTPAQTERYRRTALRDAVQYAREFLVHDTSPIAFIYFVAITGFESVWGTVWRQGWVVIHFNWRFPIHNRADILARLSRNLCRALRAPRWEDEQDDVGDWDEERKEDG